MTLESEVLLRISPSAERRREIQDIVRSLLARTEEEAGKDGRDLSVVLVGSVAKDTFLREPDIDIFVQFPEEVDRDDMEAVGLSVGKRGWGVGRKVCGAPLRPWLVGGPGGGHRTLLSPE